MCALRTLPGTNGLPIIGETPYFLYDIQTFIERRVRIYGPLFRTHLLRLPTLFSCSYATTAKLCALEASSAYQEFMATLYPHSNLMLSPSNSEIRQTAERHFLPALTAEAIPKYRESLLELVGEMMDELKGNERFKPYERFKPVCERIVTRVLFGNVDGEMHLKMRALASAHFNAVVAAPVHFEMLGRQSAHTRGLASYAKLQALLQEIVRERKGVTTVDNVLDYIVHELEQNGMFSEDVENQLVHFMLLLLSPAIPKSLASAMASVVRRVCDNEGLQDEILNGGVHEVLMETLRLDPPLPGGMRLVRNEVVDGVKLRGMWRAWFSIRHANRDEKVYQQADEFRIERWKGKKRKIGGCPFAGGGMENVPFSFGGGGRDCPGRDLAWEILKEMVEGVVEALVLEGREEGQGIRILPVLRQVGEGQVLARARVWE